MHYAAPGCTQPTGNQLTYHLTMRLLEALASAFISTFGITQPTDRTRRRAAWFILGMLTLVFLGLCIGGSVLFHLMQI
jgi:hypothetical protein